MVAVNQQEMNQQQQQQLLQSLVLECCVGENSPNANKFTLAEMASTDSQTIPTQGIVHKKQRNLNSPAIMSSLIPLMSPYSTLESPSVSATLSSSSPFEPLETSTPVRRSRSQSVRPTSLSETSLSVRRSRSLSVQPTDTCGDVKKVVEIHEMKISEEEKLRLVMEQSNEWMNRQSYDSIEPQNYGSKNSFKPWNPPKTSRLVPAFLRQSSNILPPNFRPPPIEKTKNFDDDEDDDDGIYVHIAPVDTIMERHGNRLREYFALTVIHDVPADLIEEVESMYYKEYVYRDLYGSLFIFKHKIELFVQNYGAHNLWLKDPHHHIYTENDFRWSSRLNTEKFSQKNVQVKIFCKQCDGNKLPFQPKQQVQQPQKAQSPQKQQAQPQKLVELLDPAIISHSTTPPSEPTDPVSRKVQPTQENEFFDPAIIFQSNTPPPEPVKFDSFEYFDPAIVDCSSMPARGFSIPAPHKYNETPCDQPKQKREIQNKSTITTTSKRAPKKNNNKGNKVNNFDRTKCSSMPAHGFSIPAPHKYNETPCDQSKQKREIQNKSAITTTSKRAPKKNNNKGNKDNNFDRTKGTRNNSQRKNFKI
ncbi:hypothetical protein HELRODRAFT_178263 [Helobdella robusta]|uniref:Uncharacterized protein n=1 Tax=Helobdella robusta TaxID=6412 RepID=T1FD03_HELRO|nr:hypothetical protein HELRODRAFT_178263 [Helobdella robusta]ESN97154.1 hypothetical protein HELRODRAFT_178263 [Helobdella robusta]